MPALLFVRRGFAADKEVRGNADRDSYTRSVDPYPVIRFVGDTPVITIDRDANEEPDAGQLPRHRASCMPSPWRGWCWRCRCGARGSSRSHADMMAAVADHLG